MRFKSNLTGSILSDGSSQFVYKLGHLSKWCSQDNNIDVINHFIWSGKRVKEQTDITSFIKRFNKTL